MTGVHFEVLIPERVETLQLSAAIKASVAAALSSHQDTKVVISALVDRVTLVVTQATPDANRATRIVEPNAIVRLFTASTTLESPFIAFEEEKLFPVVKDAAKLDPSLAKDLVGLLPKQDTGAEAVILFADLHALVMARGKAALAAEAEVLMWYQKTISIPRVRSAMLTAMKSEYAKPPKNGNPSANAPGASAKAAAPSTTSELSKGTLPAPVEVPVVKGPTVDESVVVKPLAYPILPDPKKRNVLITSALPYVNNVPHLGNIVGSVLSADFYSRYCKARGYNTLFVCGTDEYGTATETKAIEEGVTPMQLCTHFHAIHKEVYDWFQIGFDFFGRTSTEKQTEIAQDVFNKLGEHDYLEERPMTQLYCEKHEGYLADRFVEGTCPKCGYDDARGDQCDNCGQLLDAFELINPRCKLDGTSPIKRETKHVFLRLDKLQPELEDWLETSMGEWSKNAQTITKNWIKEGLQARAITRDLKWGTPVPRPGFEDKVLYVWFDAPIGYPSITANYTDEWARWWKPNKEDKVKLYQFMGKDNVPFHGVIWPSCEIGARDNWKLVDHLSATEYLQYEGGKFSKSRNLGVFGNNARDIKLSPSIWRYYLANARPETGDSQFSWADFVGRNNHELLPNLGNFVNRVMKFTNSKYNSGVPSFKPLPNDSPVIRDFNERLNLYVSALERVQIREGIEHAIRFSARGNQYLQDSKLDNTLFAEHPEECAQVIGTSLNMIYILSALISPYMPETSQQIVDQLNVPLRLIPDTVDFAIKPGHQVGKAKHLFSRIDPEKIDEWLAKYGGGAEAQKEQEAAKEKKKAKKAAKKQQSK